MKYLLIFLFFVLCFFDVSEMIRYDETENLSLIVNDMITTNNSWKCIIQNREILINNTFQTIEIYLTQISEQLKPSTKYFVSKSYVLQTLNFMYTALKCEYAYLIRDILKFIFHQNYGHKLILRDLKKLRNPLDKVIFNLFNFKDLSSDLKSSDQTLTISLLSIYVLLYKENISSKKDTLLAKWIHQMISLIEIFICRTCLFKFSDLDTSKNNTELKMDDYLSRLEEKSDIGLKNNKYNKFDMYKPNNFLMYDYTKGIGLYDVKIKFTSFSTDIFQSGITSYNMENVLISQIFLIESLRSLFSQQIMNVLKNITNGSNDNFSQIDMLYDGFLKYKDLIPDNYPPNFLKFIHDIENALTDFLESGKNNFESLNDIINNILSTESIIHLDTINSKIDNMTITSITDFIEKIKGSPYFPSFKQTFEISLQEPHMLKEYYILDEIVYDKITNASNKPSDTCLIVPKLRIGFIWIWTMLDKIKDEKLEESFNSYLINVFQHVNYLYEFKGTKPMVKNTLLHLLNHVKDSSSQLFTNFKSSEFVILKQLVLSTVVAMGYHELNNCDVTEEKNTIFGELNSVSSFPFTVVRESVDIEMQTICNATGQVNNGTFDVKKGQTYIDTINSLDEVDSDRSKFYWKVYEKQILNICQDLYQDFKTPDNHQIDHKFQSTVLEWYLYQAYTKVVCMFKFPNKQPSYEQIIFIKKSLKNLWESLTFSTYSMRIVRYFIKIYLDYFLNETIEEESVKQFTIKVNNEYEAPNVSIDKFKHIDDFYNSFQKDIEFIKYYFIDTKNNTFIVDEHDLAVLMFWNKLEKKKE